MWDLPVPQGPAMRTATFSATKRQVARSAMRVWSMAGLKSKSNCSIVFRGGVATSSQARGLGGTAKLRRLAPTHQPGTGNGAVGVAQPHARKDLSIFEHL